MKLRKSDVTQNMYRQNMSIKNLKNIENIFICRHDNVLPMKN